MKRKWLAIGIILLFIGAGIIPSTAEDGEKSSLIVGCGGDHVPIHIDGNDEFTLENGVIGGDGTENNPYLIENWVFVGSEQAISIWNTNAFFIIRNCTIHGFPNGIYFFRVTNGSIEKTTIDNCEHGIMIQDSQNIVITDNTIISYTIYMVFNSKLTVSRNMFTGHIHIGGNNDYTFSYNTLINCSLHIYGNCSIYRNNFMTTTPEIERFLIEIYVPLFSHVIFLGNFWLKPSFFPRFILGIIYKEGIDEPEFILPRFFIDWLPAKEPYNIPSMS